MSLVLLRAFVYRCYSGAKQEEAHYLETRTLMVDLMVNRIPLNRPCKKNASYVLPRWRSE